MLPLQDIGVHIAPSHHVSKLDALPLRGHLGPLQTSGETSYDERLSTSQAGLLRSSLSGDRRGRATREGRRRHVLWLSHLSSRWMKAFEFI
ncbi:hypothetical protein CCMA1212_004781 [Trichoderma ghanense]|uniref:Uncharacterized protein n=1 Tax=Trichoderma ghanense TaxID=65468 RepID=A0ABY2H8C6_9HYPO